MEAIDWRTIEAKWQRKWAEAKIFEADPDWNRPKCFLTFPYPYMSGPLHVGHGYSSTRLDVYARYKRMRGYNVLFPWAWHWTGETVAGASERIKLRDEAFIRALKDADGVLEEELERFVDPAYMARYYTDYNRKAVKELGLSVDWRREFHTTSLHPTYSKFIEWQYKKLKQKNYVVQGTHPLVWCPRCESPTGEADRLKGSGVSPEEYTLVKFKCEEAYLPAATLRPETIFGVTNVWLNPESVYVEVDVDGQKWIVSREAADKLKDQLRKVQVLRVLKGADLIGKTCGSPAGPLKIPILPGWFVDPKNATGIVYSVPAHAPYDWLALRDLQKNVTLLVKFGISPKIIEDMKPISIIKVEEFGEFPAVEIVERMNIKDPNDPKADEATKIIYKKEFHRGILKENCDGYVGKTVSEVKQKLIEDFKQKGSMDSMYELPQEVVCRCTTVCHVKVLRDQWFLNYSNPEWKTKTKKAVAKMEFYPEDARKWFEDVIDWLHDWACTRRTGLGTPLPWSQDWIVETLSDSTVYQAFYTIYKHISQLGLTAEQLTEEFFDYVFYGLGNPDSLQEACHIKPETLNDIRQEFLYWYPVDLRNSGKDLVPNHLTFYLFHHTALFPPEHWPKSIGVNGFMRVEGEEMHKSKGNFIPLRRAVENFGTDVTRCTVLLAAEGMDDPDWRAASLNEVRRNLNNLYRFIIEVRSTAVEIPPSPLEKWLKSTIQHHINKVSESIETLKTRTALDTALYELWNKFRWYLRRVEKPCKETIIEATSIWVRLLSPFIPHLTEEFWEKFGEKGFISCASWPSFETAKVDVKSEEAEDLIMALVEDTKNILKATGIVPKKTYYYVASDWKWKVYLTLLERHSSQKAGKELIRELMAQPEIRKHGTEAANFINNLINEISKMPTDILSRKLTAARIDEFNYLKNAEKFFKKEFNASIQVHREDESDIYNPKGRAKLAKPYHPAIYIE